MEFDFENYKYFGHATGSNADIILEEGLNINEDIYLETKLESTTLEITIDDLEDGIDQMLLNEFSIGINSYRKYVIIISCSIDDYNEFYNKVKHNKKINTENIVGYYDTEFQFYENDNFEYDFYK